MDSVGESKDNLKGSMGSRVLEVESDELCEGKLAPEDLDEEDTSQWKPERFPESCKVVEEGGFNSNMDFL